MKQTMSERLTDTEEMFMARIPNGDSDLLCETADIRWDIRRMQMRADELHARLDVAGKGAMPDEWDAWQEMLGGMAGLEMSYDMFAPKGLGGNIRNWYLSAYPEDSSGCRINETATFADLNECVDEGRSFKSVLSVDDEYFGSHITRRCLTRLAELWHVSYDDIYGKWIDQV